MKTFKTLCYALTVFTALIFSCSSDSDSNGGGDEDLANQQNITEENAVATSALSSGIEIAGATKNDGTPPQPNSNIDLTISSDKVEAHQSSGFNLKFSTAEDNIAGAYLLFKDVNNNGASNYFDVPFSSFTTSKNANTKTNKSSKNKLFSKGNGLTDNEYEIDIDFGDAIPAGQFCGDLCIYDSENNISQIVTVCVEVEAWGGNAEIVGEWIFDRFNDENANNTSEINCTNGETITVNYYRTDETWFLVLNSDGSYYETYTGFDESLDLEKTQSSCSAIYNKEDNDDKYSGNWAYNEDKQTLTIIDFKYENFLDASKNEVYPDGSIYFDGTNTTAKVISGELVIVDTYNDGIETYTETYIFKRK